MRTTIAFVSFLASAAAFAPSSLLPQVRNDLSVRKAWDNDRRPQISPVDDLPSNGYGQQRLDGTYQNNYQGNDYPTRVDNNNYYRPSTPIPPELPYNNRGIAPEDTLAAFKSILAGAIVGVFVIAPFSALHHLVVVPSANGLIKWEWDVVMAAVQGAGFASAYQYLLRSGDRELRNAVIIASGMIRTVGVVPYTVGGKPFTALDWNMLGSLGMHAIDSAVLFTAVATSMDYLIRERWIPVKGYRRW